MRLIANSIPKSGTHLLMELLAAFGFRNSKFWIGADLVNGRFGLAKKIIRSRMPGDKILIGCDTPTPINRVWLENRLNQTALGSFSGAHCLYSDDLHAMFNNLQFRVTCVVRDPRAIAVSHMHHIMNQRSHLLHNPFKQAKSDIERIHMSIDGFQTGEITLRSLKDRYGNFLGWKDKASIIRYEDLVGPKGGGTAEKQHDTISRLSTDLGLNYDEFTIQTISESLFGTGRTFRNGDIYGWKNELPKDIILKIENQCGVFLHELGYS